MKVHGIQRMKINDVGTIMKKGDISSKINFEFCIHVGIIKQNKNILLTDLFYTLSFMFF